MAQIRRHIKNLGHDKPFSTREFLTYGTRKAVDQALWRLVNLGELIRVARGLFIKSDAPQPSLTEIAKAKAAAFGKQIATHGAIAAKELGLTKESTNQQIFATDGRSSSFRAGRTIIRLISTSPRKFRGGNNSIGLIIRALWHIGKHTFNPSVATIATTNLNRDERQLLYQFAYLMPDWMARHLITRGKWRPRQCRSA